MQIRYYPKYAPIQEQCSNNNNRSML